jgi:type IV pilus assembly protein PilQ
MPSKVPSFPSQGGTIEMKLRRLPDSVELVIEGAGAAPQLRQNTSGSTWQGLMITSSPNGLRRGPQRLSLPEAGLESVSIEGSGTTYRLSITPVPGSPLGRPVVSADGRNLILSFSAPNQPTLQTLSPNITTPGRVPQPSYVPPLQPRAVAPPVGDMAVGTMMLSNPSYVNVSGPSVTMTLKNAPAKDVLMAITRLGGYGFVFVDDPLHASGGGRNQDGQAQMRPISISFRNETYGRALNSALLAAGLQGKREGNMILAGPSVLGKSFGAQMSKVYRLNQASATRRLIIWPIWAPPSTRPSLPRQSHPIFSRRGQPRWARRCRPLRPLKPPRSSPTEPARAPCGG